MEEFLSYAAAPRTAVSFPVWLIFLAVFIVIVVLVLLRWRKKMK